MFIDPLNGASLVMLGERLNAMPPDVNLYLLIDGVFVPGLFRSREFETSETGTTRLLFEALPSCGEAVRDVSPFLVSVKVASPRLLAKLSACSGWPMLSAIETTEDIDELAARLSAWCVIENDGQRFNFRFPDTRRLPCIFDTLSARQRAEFTGPMRAWSYIARDGNWQHLHIAGTNHDAASNPSLDDAQFATMVGDSEPDEVLSHLVYGGFESTASLSVQYLAVRAALRTAADHDLPENFRLA